MMKPPPTSFWAHDFFGTQSIEQWFVSEAEHSNLLALDMEWVPDRSLAALGTSGGCLKRLRYRCS